MDKPEHSRIDIAPAAVRFDEREMVFIYVPHCMACDIRVRRVSRDDYPTRNRFEKPLTKQSNVFRVTAYGHFVSALPFDEFVVKDVQRLLAGTHLVEVVLDTSKGMFRASSLRWRSQTLCGEWRKTRDRMSDSPLFSCPCRLVSERQLATPLQLSRPCCE